MMELLSITAVINWWPRGQIRPTKLSDLARNWIHQSRQYHVVLIVKVTIKTTTETKWCLSRKFQPSDRHSW